MFNDRSIHVISIEMWINALQKLNDLSQVYDSYNFVAN